MGRGGRAGAGAGAMLGKDYMLAIVLVNCDGQPHRRGGGRLRCGVRGRGGGAGPAG